VSSSTASNSSKISNSSLDLSLESKKINQQSKSPIKSQPLPLYQPHINNSSSVLSVESKKINQQPKVEPQPKVESSHVYQSRINNSSLSRIPTVNKSNRKKISSGKLQTSTGTITQLPTGMISQLRILPTGQ
jgi:hypothetical protein